MIEKVLNTKTWFEGETTQKNGVTSHQIPLADSIGIAISATVAFALNVTVERNIQMVVVPSLVPRCQHTADMLHTLVDR